MVDAERRTASGFTRKTCSQSPTAPGSLWALVLEKGRGKEGRDPQVLDVQGTSALHISTWTVVLSQPLHTGGVDQGASRRKQKDLLCPSLTRGLGHTPSLPWSSSVPDVDLNHRTASTSHSALLQPPSPSPLQLSKPPGTPLPTPPLMKALSPSGPFAAATGSAWLPAVRMPPSAGITYAPHRHRPSHSIPAGLWRQR